MVCHTSSFARLAPAVTPGGRRRERDFFNSCSERIVGWYGQGNLRAVGFCGFDPSLQAAQPAPKVGPVTCRDFDDVMSSRSGNWAHAEGYAEHLRGCQRCRSLTRLLEEAGKGPVPSESQLKRIQAGIVEHLEPVRPLPPSRVFLAAFAFIFLVVVAAGALRLGTNGWSALNIWQRIGVFASLAASAIFLAGSMVRQMVPGSTHAVPPQ